MGASELGLLAGCLVLAIVPPVLIFVVVKLLKQVGQYSTPEARLKEAATLLPWGPQAFGDLAAELDASWSRGPGGTTLSGRIRSLTQKDRAWILFYAQRQWAGTGTVFARSSAGEVTLKVDNELVQVWIDGVLLGQLLRKTGQLHSPTGAWGTLLAQEPNRVGVDINVLGGGPIVRVSEVHGAKSLVLGTTPVARILPRRRGDPATPLVQLAGPVPTEAAPWLVFAALFEIAWSGAEQPR